MPGESPKFIATPVGYSALNGWQKNDLRPALIAFQRSCSVFLRSHKEAKQTGQIFLGKHIDWRPACRAGSKAVSSDEVRAFFETWFRPHLIADKTGKSTGRFTGYFEPNLRGSLKPDGRYLVPIYARPKNLITVDLGEFDKSLRGRRLVGRVVRDTLRRYPDRRTIERNGIRSAAPLVWADSAVDVFFLHIQGSGRINLAQGGVMRVGYSANNGWPYTAIGRVLIARGAISPGQVSMQSIRAWLVANPSKAVDVMTQNARYIFFRKLNGDGPLGALGVKLTPGRSLAVDRRFIPLGAPLWVETNDPLQHNRPFRRLMIAQDVGGAITGAVRGDIFFGHGRLAARRAGLMNEIGRYFILLPNDRPNRQ